MVIIVGKHYIITMIEESQLICMTTMTSFTMRMMKKEMMSLIHLMIKEQANRINPKLASTPPQNRVQMVP